MVLSRHKSARFREWVGCLLALDALKKYEGCIPLAVVRVWSPGAMTNGAQV